MTASTTIPAQQPLTEHNLAVHNNLLDLHTPEGVISWVEKLITEERTHKFFSQLSESANASLFTNLDNADTHLELDMERLDQQLASASASASASATANATADFEYALDSLKLFEQRRPCICLESPLERFLTPGCSEPSYFYRPALAHMGIQFGSMEGSGERRDIARANVELVRDRAFRACEMDGIIL